jgi:hypothetical protein
MTRDPGSESGIFSMWMAYDLDIDLLRNRISLLL